MGKAKATPDPGSLFHEGDPSVLDFKTPVKDERPWQPVTIDGHLCAVREPKGAWFLGLAQHFGDDANEAEAAVAVDASISKIFDPESAQWLRDRMNDDGDDFDVQEVGKVLERLREVWSKARPTGRASESRKRSSSTGRRSGGTSRGKAAPTPTP